MSERLNMRRALLIARRDYLGYIKTWGFWISFFLPFIFGILAVVATQLDLDFEPPRYEAILDETGVHSRALIARYEERFNEREQRAVLELGKAMLPEADAQALEGIINSGGAEAGKAFLNAKFPGLGDQVKLPDRKLIFLDPPRADIGEIKTFLAQEGTLNYAGEDVVLNGVLHIKAATENRIDTEASTKAVSEQSEPIMPAQAAPIEVDYWSVQINAFELPNLAKSYFRDLGETRYLGSGDLSREGLSASRDNAVDFAAFNPAKVSTAEGGQKVTNHDRLPFIVAGIMAMMLWLAVFSGAYMLLTSMLEEKLNKLLEMMLASTHFGEIIVGKLIGVAALTITAMMPYLLIGVGSVIAIVLFGDAQTSEALKQTFTWKMAVFFPLFLVLGYLFYGALFIAMGALAESMQDAQTITTPIVMVLTLCVLVVPMGIKNPDSPILIFASWFPLSAPFAAIARLPSDPPFWELALSAGFLALLSAGVIMLAGRVFRYGVLSGAGVKGAMAWIKRVIFRRTAA